MPKTELITLALEESPTQRLIAQALQEAGFRVETVESQSGLEKSLLKFVPAVVVVGETLGESNGLGIAVALIERFPTLPVVLVSREKSLELFQQAVRVGIGDVLIPPLKPEEVTETIVRIRKRADLMGDWVRKEVRRNTQTLERRIVELEALVRIGRQLTGSLDLEDVLKSVVTAAMQLTAAEGGALLLRSSLDDQKIYIRAACDLQQLPAHTVNLPVEDNLAEQVLRTGETFTYHDPAVQTILGDVDARSIIYIPMMVNKQAIGLLGVYHQQIERFFRDYDVLLMSVLADYAAIAIENARLYQISQVERQKLETTLNGIAEGVIVLDEDRKVLFVNQAARHLFGLGFEDISGSSVLDLISHPDFVDMVNSRLSKGDREECEIEFEDGRVFNALYLPVVGVGRVVTIQDITNLKMVDRIKSDFIHTVSHDLRSPLTAILGYVELLERIGPLNEQQHEFVRRVQTSVHSITSLVNDLLDLGRIEAGFDTGKDEVSLKDVLQYTIETLNNQILDKKISLEVVLSENLPALRGNPIRLRQLMDNLVSNAVKYTPAGGKISVDLVAEDDQIILQVTDTGVGIPLSDQPHIFEKFYRASNAPKGTPGTGLGLAIVKSIVENHEGRIWVESTPGIGTRFYVVLPVFRGEDRS